ncbi:MAG TPA: DUF4079 family protein [Candidatus Binatia bacterium]|jgi:hypothetical protein
MIPYLHPILAGFVLVLLAYVASLGVLARNDRRHRAQHLREHSLLAPWMYAAVVVLWCAGLGVNWAIARPGEAATSTHFKIGTGLVATLSAAALASRWMHIRSVRAIHPWIGALALLLAAAQVVYGLQLLP